MTDHEIAQLVNDICDTAKAYANSQQMREKIARLVVPAIKRADQPFISFDDGTKVFINGWTGDDHADGWFGQVTLRFVESGGAAVVRTYTQQETQFGGNLTAIRGAAARASAVIAPTREKARSLPQGLNLHAYAHMHELQAVRKMSGDLE
jgi:hypothetical protein